MAYTENMENKLTPAEYKIAVHAGHCCAEHGCKYGDNTCPVVLKDTLQEYPCEDCRPSSDVEQSILRTMEALIHELEWSKSLEARGMHITHSIY